MTPDYQALAKQEIEKYGHPKIFDEWEDRNQQRFEAAVNHAKHFAAQAQQGIIDALSKEAPLSLSHDHHVILKEAILNYKI